MHVKSHSRSRQASTASPHPKHRCMRGGLCLRPGYVSLSHLGLKAWTFWCVGGPTPQFQTHIVLSQVRSGGAIKGKVTGPIGSATINVDNTLRQATTPTYVPAGGQ